MLVRHAGGEFVENIRRQIVLSLFLHQCRIADDAVSHHKRPLGGLHNAVQIFKRLGFVNLKPFEDR